MHQRLMLNKGEVHLPTSQRKKQLHIPLALSLPAPSTASGAAAAALHAWRQQLRCAAIRFVADQIALLPCKGPCCCCGGCAAVGAAAAAAAPPRAATVTVPALLLILLLLLSAVCHYCCVSFALRYAFHPPSSVISSAPTTP